LLPDIGSSFLAEHVVSILTVRSLAAQCTAYFDSESIRVRLDCFYSESILVDWNYFDSEPILVGWDILDYKMTECNFDGCVPEADAADVAGSLEEKVGIESTPAGKVEFHGTRYRVRLYKNSEERWKNNECWY
jgi:hypothetical protein